MKDLEVSPQDEFRDSQGEQNSQVITSMCFALFCSFTGSHKTKFSFALNFFIVLTIDFELINVALNTLVSRKNGFL